MRLRHFVAAALLAVCSTAYAVAQEGGAAKTAAIFWGVKGFPQGLIENTIPQKSESIGFTVSDAHKRINEAYVTRYGSTTLDMLNFIGIGNEKAMAEVINRHPKSAAFIPLTLFSYKSKGVDRSWVGLLAPEYMADAVGLHDPKLRNQWIDGFAPLHAMIEAELKPTMVEKATYTSVPDEPIYEVTYPVKGDIAEFSESFQEKFEEAFEGEDFIIAGYRDIKGNLDALGIENNYDAFWVYSICHFDFSNHVFNKIPRAGLFAPCSFYMYIPKGEKKLYVGYPTLANWVTVIGISDPEDMALVEEYHNKVNGLLEGMGGQKILMTKMAVVKERKPVELPEGMLNTSYTVQNVQSSDVVKQLKAKGFKVLAEHYVSEDASLKTLLFTRDDLIAQADKATRGFAAVLRVMVDDGRKEAIVLNPEYQLRAFMQKEADEGAIKKITTDVIGAFDNPQITIPDMLEKEEIGSYHFMIGMPYYEEMIPVASGTSADLLAAIKANGGKSVLFDLELSKDRHLLAVDLGRKVEKFVYKTGTDEALLLPYLVLIENGEAKILAPKYYIALMYPSLSMGEFMKIANIPGIIENSIKKLF